jgi:hypothetical protein
MYNKRGSIQNVLDWCRHLYNSCGSAKHGSQLAKLWTQRSTAKFCGDGVKTCEDVAPNFDKNRPGYFTMTKPRLTLPSSPSSFWPNTKMAAIPHPPYSPDFEPCEFFLFPNMKFKLKGSRFDTLTRSRPNHRECSTLWQKGTSRRRFKKWKRRWEQVYTCGRDLLRGWWRPIGFMVSFMIFTASVSKWM